MTARTTSWRVVALQATQRVAASVSCHNIAQGISRTFNTCISRERAAFDVAAKDIYENGFRLQLNSETQAAKHRYALSLWLAWICHNDNFTCINSQKSGMVCVALASRCAISTLVPACLFT